MEEAKQDVNTEGEGTPAASPAAEPTKTEDRGAKAPAAEGVTSGESKSDDRRPVDAERLNSLIADSKELKSLREETASSQKATQDRLQAAADALTGSQGSASKTEMDKLADEYNVPIEYLQKQNSIMAKMVKEELRAELAPLKQGQEELKYQKQEQLLAEKFPEVSSLSSEEKVDLRKLAYSKEYLNTPLEAVYARYILDRPEGRPKTFESGSGGPRSAQTETSISDMTDAEFIEYSNEMGKKSS